MKGDVSVKVAARFFRVTEVTIIRKCKAKIFPTAYQLGENCPWYIPAADILRIHPDPEYAEMRLIELARVLDK